MSLLIKGILSFPTLFTPEVAKGATEAKFSCTVLLPPNDPQIPSIQAAVDEAKLNGFPNGMSNRADVCFQLYDTKYQGKDYYDPRFSGWYVLSCTAKADDRPAVVDSNRVPIIDPGVIYSGCIAYVNLGISAYTKGNTGIGGWLNGVLFEGEEGQFGRLDGKPTVDQMFAGMGNAPPAAPSDAPAPVHQMTALANGATYESFIQQGWTDETLIANGYMLPPGGVPTTF